MKALVLRSGIRRGIPDEAALGVILIALSALCWSTAGLFTRLLPQDSWAILFWRGLFGALFTAVCALRASGGDPAIFRLERGHWPVLVWMSLGTLAFIPALKLAGIATVAVIYATTPLVVAGLAWLWLRERLRRATLLAGLIAVAGVGIMVQGRPAGSGTLGLILACVMAFSMAMTAISFRKHRTILCWPVAALSNGLTAAIAAIAAPSLAVAAGDLFWLVLFGLVQMTLGLGLFVLGMRRLPAAEAAVIGLIETPLAPLWVWLAFGEAPSGQILLGGAAVIVAAAAHLLTEPGWRRHYHPADT